MRVVVIVAVGSWLTATASAQPSTPVDDPPIVVRAAPADRSWYGTIAPAAQLTVPRSRFRRAIARGGLVTLAGITRTSDASLARIDLGIPTPRQWFRRLRTFVIAEVGMGEDPHGTATATTRDLAIAPSLQYDWRLPFGPASGDLVLVAGAGLSWRRHWVRLPDEPFWPASWESSTEYDARFEVALQYRGANGLVVSLHLPAANLPLNDPSPPDARWMAVEPVTHYSASLLAGYQFQ